MKLGKLPARKDSIKLKLADYLVAQTPPTKAGHQNLVLDWDGLLGNDQYGDCVWAGAAHETILWNTEAKQSVTFTEQSVLSDYSAVTGFNPKKPATDKGTDVQIAASYRLKTGVKDETGKRHQVAAYLAIDQKNLSQLRQAIYQFSNVGIGIEFPSSAMTQFNDGKPWSVVNGAKIEGGHYIPAIGYDSQYIYVVTWGKLQKMTWGFYAKYCDEAIVYLSDEMLSGGKSIDGFNATQLQADLSQLTKGESMSLRTFIEPKEKVIVNIVITFIQSAFGVILASVVAGNQLNKLTIGAAGAAGLSAVWNLILKPYLIQQGWLKG